MGRLAWEETGNETSEGRGVTLLGNLKRSWRLYSVWTYAAIGVVALAELVLPLFEARIPWPYYPMLVIGLAAGGFVVRSIPQQEKRRGRKDPS